MDLVVSGILNFLTEQEAIGKADEVQDFYRYGIEITISSMLNIVLVLLMGALTGHLLESVIYLAVFIAVRVITGGYHADTYFRCNLLMCSTFIATAFLNDKVCGYINIWVIAAFVYQAASHHPLWCISITNSIDYAHSVIHQPNGR